MKVNKSFINILSDRKISSVGEVVKEMGIFEFKDNAIQNIKNNYPKLEEIFYTVWFLEKNNLIDLSKGAENTRISFSFEGIEPDDYVYERFKYLQVQIDDTWGRQIKILPSFYHFIANDYLTDSTYLEWIKFRMALFVAIVASVVTGLSTTLFNIWLN